MSAATLTASRKASEPLRVGPTWAGASVNQSSASPSNVAVEHNLAYYKD